MKKSKITLTDSFVLDKCKAGKNPLKDEKGIPKKQGVKYCIWDNLCPGFGIEVPLSGVKLMVVKTCQDGRRAWHTLGTYGQSGEERVEPVTGRTKGRKWNIQDYRLKAQILKDQVKKGEDPKAAIEAKKAASLARRQRLTVNQLADRFIKDHIRAEVTKDGEKFIVTKTGMETSGNRLSTAKEHVRLIERYIRPTLGPLPVEDIGTSEVAGMLRKIQDETPIQANRVRSVLSKMFGRAEIWEYRPAGSNPVRGQDREPENKRERNMTDREIQALGQGLKAAANPPDGAEKEAPLPTPHALAAMRLALLTGMRRGEILALRWEWIDLEAGELRIPADFHKTGAKTRRERVVLLCKAACTLLKSLTKNLGNPYVISGRGRAALVNLQKPWEVVRKAAGLDHEDAEKQVHFHDLRRTFASVATRMGYPEIWIGALLGHSAGTVTAGYARADMQDDPLRKALEAIGGRIAGLMDGTIDLEKEAKDAKKKGKVRA